MGLPLFGQAFSVRISRPPNRIRTEKQKNKNKNHAALIHISSSLCPILLLLTGFWRMCGWFSSDGRRPRWTCGRGRFGADKAGDLTPVPETWTSYFFLLQNGDHASCPQSLTLRLFFDVTWQG